MAGQGAEQPLATTTALTSTQSLTPGDSYSFGVTCGIFERHVAFALAGYQESAAAYTGMWTTTSFAGAWGGTARYSTAPGASASFTCTCSAIAWVTDEGSNHGSAKVYVDGTLKSTVSTQASSNRNRVIAWNVGWPSLGVHTIRIVNVATAGHPRVNVDGFVTRS